MIKTIGINSKSFEESTVDSCLQYLASLDVIGLDTETTGYFNFKNFLLLLQVGNKDVQYIIDATKVNLLQFKDLLESKIVIMHNAKFDYKFIKNVGIDIKNIYDTFLAECVLYTGYNMSKPEKPYYIGTSLKDVVNRYCGVDLDKTIRGIIHKENNSDRVIIYAANDIAYLEDVRNKQLQRIKELDLESVIDLENKVVRVFSIMEMNGIKIDPNKWLKVSDVTKQNALGLEKELDDIIIEEAKINRNFNKYINNQTTLFDIEYRGTYINWASSQQKVDILNKVGVKCDSAEMDILIKNQNKHRLIPKLIELSKQKKLSTTYGEKFLDYINPITGRIHTDFWQVLSSGRVSSNNPSLLNIPAHGKLAEAIKESFIAEEGNILLDTDYSQFELRIIAELSQDKLWIDAFNNDEDLHSVLCAATFEIPIEDVKKPFPYRPEVNYRFVQKTVNFGLIYGMSEFKLSSTIQVSINQAKEIIEKFFSVVPDVKRFLDLVGAVGRIVGAIRSPAPYRRIRFFPQHKDAIETNNEKELGSIERSSKNHPVQSTNANITKLALCNIQSKIDKEALPIKLLLPIHDAILVECSNSVQEYAKSMIQEEMINAARVVIKSVPIKVDTVVGEYWKH